MNQAVETELQKARAAYRAQESEIESQVALIAKFRQQLSGIDAEIETVKAVLATPSNLREIDLTAIRILAAEQRQTENQLEQLGQERAAIAAQIRNAERRLRTMEQEIKERQPQFWKALFDDLKASIDAETLEELFVAGLQAGLGESTLRADLLPKPAEPDVVADRLRARFALPPG